MTLPPDLSLPLALWLGNLTIAAVLISLSALAAERLLRHRSLPVRHGILLSALALTALSPVLILIALQSGLGVAVPLSWSPAVVVETEDLAPKHPVIDASFEQPTPPASDPPVAAMPDPLTLGDVLRPGEILEFHQPQPTLDLQSTARNQAVAHNEAPVVEDVVAAMPPAQIIDWRPTITKVAGWWGLIWCLGAAVAGLRLLTGWRQVWRLRASMRPVADHDLLETSARTADAVGLHRTPRLMSSPRVPVPAVCGLWRPVIVLPEGFIDEVPHESVESILLHESAHIKRHDLWIGWLQRLVGVLFWWNVPLDAVQRRLSDLREDLCDNHVLAHHPDGRGYARVLLDLVSRASGNRPVPASVGLVEGPSSGLSARITRLLQEDRNMATKLNKGPAVGLFAMAALIAVAIGGLSLRTEQAVADGSGTGAPEAVNPAAAESAIGNPSDTSSTLDPPADQPSPGLQLTEQTEILAPLIYDDQMLALVNSEGAAAVRFERQDNGRVRYEWRYLSAADAARDPKPTLEPNPHELRGEGLLEPIIMGPMPYIDAGPIDLLWFPNTELQGWVSFNPAMLEVLPFKRSLFAVQEGMFGSFTEALDLSALLVSDDVPGDRTDVQLPSPIRQVTSRLVYDAMVLVVSHPQGVAAFEFNDPFSEGNMQTQSREGVRYRCYYRDDNGIDEVVGFSEVYEIYQNGQYNQGKLKLEAGPLNIEWSNGDLNVGWIYYDPRDVHCWLVSREYFEQFLPAGSSATDRRFDLSRFRHGARPLIPPVDPFAVADTGTQLAVDDDADHEQQRRQRIADAIDKGIEFLVAQQDATGRWSTEDFFASHAIGIHSLACLGLLECGTPIDDPVVARALNWLRDQDDPDRTYDIALMLIALAAAGDEADQPRIAALAAALEGIQVDEFGGWGYDGRGGSWWDNSNSHYAVYGLYAAHLAEAEVGQKVVRKAIDHYLDTQVGNLDSEEGAGWTYRGEIGGPVSGNMTASAIASLIMLSEILEDQPELSEEDTVRIASASVAIEAGQRWLERHFTVRANPGDNSWVLCYLLNLRHAAEMAELEMIGQNDWYREGADFLVARQNANDGSWTSTAEADPVIATSMALLFLAAGIEEQNATAALSPIEPPVTEVLPFDPLGPPAAVPGPLSPQQAPTEPTNSGFPVADPMATEPFNPLGPTVPGNSPAAIDAPPGSRTLILLHLAAADDGSLKDLQFFNESLGGGGAAIETLVTRLNQCKSELATRKELLQLSAQVTADETLHYGEVVAVIDACQSAGIENVNLSTGLEGEVVEATLGYLRDVNGRKLADEPMLSIRGKVGSIDELDSMMQELSADNIGIDLRSFVLSLSVDPEVPSQVVQEVIQQAQKVGFEKFSLRVLGEEVESTDAAATSTDELPHVGGTVVQFDENEQLIELSVGHEDGVRVGHRFSIWANLNTEGSDAESYCLGTCEVVQLMSDRSIARLSAQIDRLPRQGDQILPYNVVPAAPPGLREKIDSALGLRLDLVSNTDSRLESSGFRSGLEVMNVRAGSPAEWQGIERGDILVGLHLWETTSLENVAFVLGRDDAAEWTPIKFYIVRDGEMLFGNIEPESFEAFDEELPEASALENIESATGLTMQLVYSVPDGYTLRHQGRQDDPERITAPVDERLHSVIQSGPEFVAMRVETASPDTPAARTYLMHNAVPITITEEDLDQNRARNHVVKVIYFPSDPTGDPACEVITSTRLEAGVDPLDEAQSRGEILAVVRLGQSVFSSNR